MWFHLWCICFPFLQSKNQVHRRGEYNVYSTFQSHEPEFDYLKSLEIEEKINKIRWLPQQNAAYFLLSTNGTCKWLLLLGTCRDSVSQTMHFNVLDPIFLFNLAGCQKTSEQYLQGAWQSAWPRVGPHKQQLFFLNITNFWLNYMRTIISSFQLMQIISRCGCNVTSSLKIHWMLFQEHVSGNLHPCESGILSRSY